MSSTRDHLERRLRAALRELAEEGRAPDATARRAVQPASAHPAARRRAGAAAVVVAVVGVGLAGAWQLARVPLTDEIASDAVPSPTMVSTGEVASTASREAVDAVAARATSFESSPGFGKVIADYPSGSVTILWKGEPPPEIDELADQSNQVRVILVNARLSQQDVDAAARRLLTANREALDGAIVVLVSPMGDLSGVRASVLGPWHGRASTLAEVARVPVSIVLVDEAVTPLSRQ